jgi:hypothetical protein
MNKEIIINADNYGEYFNAEYAPNAENNSLIINGILFDDALINELNIFLTKMLNLTSIYLENCKNFENMQMSNLITNFSCYKNNIVHLPQLPTSLIFLNCSNNELIELPNPSAI